MQIKSKLYFSAAGISVFVCVLLGALCLTAFKITELEKARDHFERLNAGLADLNYLLHEYLVFHEKRSEAQWNVRFATTEKEIASLTSAVGGSNPLIKELEKDYVALGKLFQELRASPVVANTSSTYQPDLRGDSRSYHELVTQFFVRSERIRSHFSELASEIRNGILDTQKVSLRAVAFVTFSLLAFAFVGASCFAVLVRNLAGLFKKLSDGARMLGAGNLDYRIDINPGDELGRVAQSFNHMAEDLRRTTVSRDSLLQEISERRRVESALVEKTALLELLQKVAFDVNSANSLDVAMESCLERICHFARWPMGHVYFPSKDGSGVMVPSALWYLEDPERYQKFRASRQSTYREPGMGLPGRVAVSRRPETLRDLRTVQNCGQLEVALQAGIRSGFAFPVMVGDRVGAVLEFFSPEYREPEKATLEALEHIGALLGRAIEREQGAAALKESEVRFRTLANVASEAIIIHEQGIILEINSVVEKLTQYSRSELIGASIFTFVEPDLLDLVREKMTMEDINYYELPLKRKDGTRIVIEVQARFLPFQSRTARVVLFRDVTQKRKAEAALRESEERFRQLSDAAFDGVEISQDGKIVEVNDGFLRLFGLSSADEVKGRYTWETVAPEFQSLVRRKTINRDEGPYEVVARDRHGKELFLEACGKNVRYHNRDARVCAIRNITARKSAERGLKDSEERFRRLSDAAFEAVIIHRNYEVLEVNQAFVKMFGFADSASALGHNVLALVAPSFRKLAEEKIKDRDEAHYEMDMLRVDGTSVTVEVRAREIPYGGGRARVATLNDVSERKHTEEMLKEREARLRLLVEQMPAILWSTDANLRFTSSVGGVFGHFSLVPNELQGKTFFEYFQSVNQNFKPIEAHRRALNGESLTFDVEWEGRMFEAHVEPLKNSSGIVTGTIGVGFDITERKASEEKLKQTAQELIRSNRELEQFAYVASHDLQEPLRMISSYMDLLSRRYYLALDQEARDFIDFAVEGAKRMKQQIDDLLAYSRVNRNAKDFGWVNCNSILEKVLFNLKLAIDESNAAIRWEPLPHVCADALQLGHLFQNLLSNALKFRSESAPEIKIYATLKGEEWVFSVEDNGIGIEMQYADRIFLIFQRLHSTSEYPGTGIGLAICQKIVERHGGRIWVERGSKQGSIFRFTLPARASEGEFAGESKMA